VSAKRSFLEKKGLNGAEIDEAFKRVPEAPAAAAAAPAPAAAAGPATTATPTYGANNLVTYTQQQPAHAAPASQALVPHVAQPGPMVPMQQQMMAPPPQPVRWTQVCINSGSTIVTQNLKYSLFMHLLLAGLYIMPKGCCWFQPAVCMVGLSCS
jgi:hypothetical protein